MQYAANQPIGGGVTGNQPMDPYLIRATDSIPGIVVGAAWNARRGSNTIRSGLTGRKWSNTDSLIKSGIPNTAMPRNWNKFGSYDALYDDAAGTYSPFQFAARSSNWLANKADMTSNGRFARYGRMAIAEGQIGRSGNPMLFGPGTVSRALAISQINSGGSTAGLSGFVGNYNQQVPSARLPGRPQVRNAIPGGAGFGVPNPTIANPALRAGMTIPTGVAPGVQVAMSVQGTMARHGLGYLTTAQVGASLAEMSAVGQKGFGSVATGMANAMTDMTNAGLRHSATGGLLTGPFKDPIGRRIAGQRIGNVRAFTGAFKAGNTAGMKIAGTRIAGTALRGVPVLGQAMLAYDLGKLAGETFKSAVSFAGEATKSIQGSLHKPIFGMGYKDTQVAATSRSRGVMAIQNSRLNARSMIGSEAGMMAAHFG
jgi:hypothetical protein